jgi:hypothetical protein
MYVCVSKKKKDEKMIELTEHNTTQHNTTHNQTHKQAKSCNYIRSTTADHFLPPTIQSPQLKKKVSCMFLPSDSGDDYYSILTLPLHIEGCGCSYKTSQRNQAWGR